ncbi:MAG: hypothetical protein AAF125_16580, partial [Chloroflexota bacterium]
MTRLLRVVGWLSLVWLALSGTLILIGQRAPLPAISVLTRYERYYRDCFFDPNTGMQACNRGGVPESYPLWLGPEGQRISSPLLTEAIYSVMPRNREASPRNTTQHYLTHGHPQGRHTVIAEHVRVDSWHLSSDGRYLYFGAEDGISNTSIFRYDVGNRTVERIYQNEGYLRCHPTLTDWCWLSDRFSVVVVLHLPTGALTAPPADAIGRLQADRHAPLFYYYANQHPDPDRDSISLMAYDPRTNTVSELTQFVPPPNTSDVGFGS